MDIIIEAILCILEPVKICMLIYYLMGTEMRKGSLWRVIIICTVLVDIVCHTLFHDSGILYLTVQTLIVEFLFVDKLYRNILRALWSIALVGIIDYFYRVIIGLVTGENDGLSVEYRLAVYICSVITIIVLGKIYTHFNRDNYRLPFYYYILFLIVGLVNGLMLNVYSTGVLKEYAGVKLPVTAIICIVVCVIGFFACMMAIMIYALMNHVYKENAAFKEEIIKVQNEHYNDLLLREEDTRRFRHDISDHLYILNDMINSKKYPEALEYLKSLNDELDSVKRVSLGNNSLDALVSHYIYLYDSQSIELKLSGFIPADMSVNTYDLCVVFSNILKNGVAYATSYVNIDIKHDDNHIYITETNDCDASLVIYNTLPKTSNKDALNHGYGLINISRIVDKYDGYINVEARDGIFKLELMLS